MKLPSVIDPVSAFEPSKPRDDQSFVEHYKDVTNYVASLLGSRQDAGDVVHDAFVRVLQQSRPQEEALRSPKSFLFRIARNLVIDGRRKQQVRARHAVADADVDQVSDPRPTPDSLVVDRERRAFLEATIAAMPERCRQCFVLHLYAGLPHAEIADRLGISKSGVEKHMARAFAACQEAFRTIRSEAR